MKGSAKKTSKYVLYVKDHDYLDTAILALRAARSLEQSEYKDCVYGYDENIHMYAKKNKTGITVTEIT